jgi:nitric oxide reductase large subunit
MNEHSPRWWHALMFVVVCFVVLLMAGCEKNKDTPSVPTDATQQQAQVATPAPTGSPPPPEMALKTDN